MSTTIVESYMIHHLTWMLPGCFGGSGSDGSFDFKSEISISFLTLEKEHTYTMDRQLTSPPLITTLSQPKRLKPSESYKTLESFLDTVPYSSGIKAQLERLTDSLGVESGFIQIDESIKREEKRRAERLLVRAEKRRIREEEAKKSELENLDHVVENLAEDDDDLEGDMENGGVGFQDESGMQDRGDVEYGDVEKEEDEDEPDNLDDAKMGESD